MYLSITLVLRTVVIARCNIMYLPRTVALRTIVIARCNIMYCNSCTEFIFNTSRSSVCLNRAHCPIELNDRLPTFTYRNQLYTIHV